ncbi:AraC-type DNA-binding protein [Enhydrobacter aerosaccus]|uniref:AraC-type DNA-binding protein n=1 Tax=Enhydrobacter aerosaccus TaxID=225324 RepID=A0A1T4SLB0_9HYPH|nr:helix-turn-helix domain-containing protein [Enhydrobacter aerosaccus]SKA28977.1 AraC-type DNA-binding protein [Enhydrobacter aerosaccus]
MYIYRRTASDNGEDLARAIPGANFYCVSESGPSFGGRYWHFHVDGLVLSRLEVDQASVVTTDERVPNFKVWHVMSPRCSANGEDVGSAELVAVRPGEGGTMRSADKADVTTFGFEASRFARAPELELPFGASSPDSAGRWRLASTVPRQRFVTLSQIMLTQLDTEPRAIQSAGVRAALRNNMLEAIVAMGEAGTFRPDRATAGRHTRIMLRFEDALDAAGDQPIDMADLCRRCGASRRSLEAIVQLRTGKSPWEYQRWRRLWRARAMLRQPGAETTVTDVAFRLGFWHLSRFAANYAATFGERPSDTLTKALGTRSRPQPRSSAISG